MKKVTEIIVALVSIVAIFVFSYFVSSSGTVHNMLGIQGVDKEEVYKTKASGYAEPDKSSTEESTKSKDVSGYSEREDYHGGTSIEESSDSSKNESKKKKSTTESGSESSNNDNSSTETKKSDEEKEQTYYY